MDKSVRKYLASIGEKGGRISKRKLTSGQARAMVKIREARRAYQKYYSQCFWSYRSDLKISIEDVKWVGEQIMKNGDREAWVMGAKLCR
ncbi:MAG: hypothetical protein HQK83_02090 [Fibrobacteria bacterium]|nr:hypothetical protein [Fibrobacteria bacterium]